MPFPRSRGHCIPLWAVFPPLQVVLSSACSVSSLSRFPSHYLPGHPHLREGALAAYLFGLGSPSTWLAGHTAVHDTPSATPPRGTERRDAPQMPVACQIVFAKLFFVGPPSTFVGQIKRLQGRQRAQNSATGTRTRVTRARAEYPNQLDYSGVDCLGAFKNMNDRK